MDKQKNILVNAATAATGGGLIVTLDIIKALCRNPDYSISLICPDFKAYRNLTVSAHKIFVPRIFLKFYFRWLLDYVWLGKTISRIQPDVIVSLGNLPAITRFKQIMFNDNAFVSETTFQGFKLTSRELLVHKLRKWLFHRRLKFVGLLVVQSEYEKQKFEKNFQKLPDIKCLKPLLPSHVRNYERNSVHLPDREDNQVRLGCISYVHGHKNIEILTEVLDITEKENFPLQLIFTLSPANSLLSRKIKVKLKRHFDSGSAINLGKIRPSQIGSLLEQIDALILPSLNESYSLNYIEAMYFIKPLLVSDRSYAREICGDYGIYFNPLLAEDIYKAIVEVFSLKNTPGSNSGKTVTMSLSNDEQLYTIVNTFSF